MQMITMVRSKQAPAWNDMAKRFSKSDATKVSFADINLSQGRITGNHSPGQGGWPTIKYFNKQTGYSGAGYAKKSNKPVCDELNHGGMEAYITEVGLSISTEL